MLLRISLVIAIIAGLGVAALNMITVKEKVVNLQTNLKDQTLGRQKAESELADTRETLAKTEKDLNMTRQTLETTTAERDQALTELAAQTRRADKLTDDLNRTRRELNDTQGELAAYTGTGFTPPQIVQFGNEIKKLNTALEGERAEKEVLAKQLKKTENELAIYKTPEYIVPLPPGLRAEVLVFDPKWNFVVLNVGENQGVLEHGELLINRDGKLVAKVRVRTVQKDRSIANIIPGWQLGEVAEGDQAIPAHPAS